MRYVLCQLFTVFLFKSKTMMFVACLQMHLLWLPQRKTLVLALHPPIIVFNFVSLQPNKHSVLNLPQLVTMRRCSETVGSVNSNTPSSIVRLALMIMVMMIYKVLVLQLVNVFFVFPSSAKSMSLLCDCSMLDHGFASFFCFFVPHRCCLLALDRLKI